jgi:uncharacterized protein YyaL (SSP411 family)
LPTRAARREYGAPACDPTVFTNWNAITVSALFKASAVLGEPRTPNRRLADARLPAHGDGRRETRRPPLLGRQLSTCRACSPITRTCCAR